MVQRCKQCKLALLCMIKRNKDFMHWCENCGGWWLPKQKLFVDCAHFLGTEDISNIIRIPYPHIIRTVKERGGVGVYTYPVFKHCPVCSPEYFDYDEYTIKIIKGISVEK